MVARQVLYCLNCASSPFCSGSFADRVSLFAQIGLDHCGWDDSLHDHASFFLLRWSLENSPFIPGYPGTAILPISTSRLGWDDRLEPLAPSESVDEGRASVWGNGKFFGLMVGKAAQPCECV
jgi:hypothetical protein